MQFIATHPKCIGVNIIEEGLMTYTGQFFKPHQPYYTKSLRGQITKYVKYFNHVNRSHYYEARPYADRPILFAISTELQNRITEMDVIVLPRIITPDLPKEFSLYGNTIFVMDLLVEREITSSKILLSILDLLIQAPLIRERRIMIKFHPEQNIQNQIIRRFQEKEIDYQIIPNHVSVEAILLNYHHLNIYGFHSSLLFYASLWGHNAYSLLEILKTIDPLTTRRYQDKNIPLDIFFQKVNMLDYQSLATKQ